MNTPELQTIMDELARMKSDNKTVHEQMGKDMQELKEKTEKMFQVFEAGSVVISFLKILGIVAIAVSGFLLTLRQLH
jgi:hypothetical protein